MRKTKKKPEQTVMVGVVTEAQIIREHYKRLGHKGGSAKTEAQTAARRRVMNELNRQRLERNKARGALEGGGNG